RSSASSARTRSPTSTTRTWGALGSSCPTGARSEPAGSRGTASSTSATSRRRSRTPARWRCCPTARGRPAMKIVLQKEVEKPGVPGDAVSVADGYARNSLIPRGFAAPATKGSAKNADRLRRAHDQKVQKAVLEAREAASKLTAAPLTVTAKAGEEGKLFGSVTAIDIARELEARTGRTRDRRTVHLADRIRPLGTHEVPVRLRPEVEAAVTVEVVAE